MKAFYGKRRGGIGLMLVLALLLQIVGPVVADYAYASNVGGDAFEATVSKIDEEDGTAEIDWSLTISSDDKEYIYPGKVDLALDGEKKGLLVTDEKETIGSYEISVDGNITVDINDETVSKLSADPEVVEVTSSSGIVGGETKKYTFRGRFEVDGIVGESEEEADSEQHRNASTSSGNELNDIFKFEFLKLGDRDTGVEIKDGDVIDFKDGTSVILEFSWDTADLDPPAEEGDWATIQLPEIFERFSTQKPLNISVTLIDGEEEVEVIVGTYTVIDGELKFIFNEKIGEVKNGYLGLGLEFDLEKFEKNIEQKIDIEEFKDFDLTVIAKPTVGVSAIEKEGHVENTHDAKEITWTIYALNGNKEAITNASVKDIIPEGLKLNGGSFKFWDLTAGYNGEKVVGDDELVSELPEVDTEYEGDESFEIKFASIAPYKGYKIQYTTNIEDYTKQPFKNSATLSYGEYESAPVFATVDGLTRSNDIEKEGEYNSETGLIEWEIYVNKSGGKIDNAVVYDNLPKGLTIVDNLINVYIIEDGGEPEPIVNDNDWKFPITLGKVESNEVYKITFETSINYGLVNDGVYEKENIFKNETELYEGEKVEGGDNKIGDANKSVTITRADILKKVGESKVDYDNKTLTWTVHVNEARHPLTGDIVLTDILPKGLGIEQKDIKITDEDGEDGKDFPLAEGAITITLIESGDNEGKTEVKIDLGDIGTKYIKIVYTTTIEDFTINKFENIASLNGYGVGTGGEIDPVPIEPAGNTFEKKFEEINYKAKTIDWKLKIDPKRDPITELKIVDTFPNKGLILLDDTVEVKVKVGDKYIDFDETKYTLTPNVEGEETGYNKGFTLTFHKDVERKFELNQEMLITYKTSYDPQRKVNEKTLDDYTPIEGKGETYKNEAKFIYRTKSMKDKDELKEETRIAETKVVKKESWDSGKKEGQLVHFNDDGAKQDGWVSGKERKIAWQLYINYQEQELGTDVEVIDTLAYKGTIDKDSIKVSVYDVNEDGTTSITGMSLLSNKYDVTPDTVTESFTLKFADSFEVNKRYVIEFLTTVPDVSQHKYTNDAVVNAGGKKIEYSSTIEYDEHNDFLDKKAMGLGDSDKVFTGDEIDWEIKVNESLSIIKNAEIVDTLSEGLVYLDGSLKVFMLGNEKPLQEGKDYSFDKSTKEGKTVLTLELDNVDTTLILEYKTVVTAKTGKVSNEVKLIGEGKEIQAKESSKLNARQFSYVGGELDPKKGMLRVTKIDSGTNETITNSEATFTLWYKINNSDKEFIQFGDEEFITTGGVLEIGNLPLRIYYLREKKAPDGYVLSEEEIVVGIDKPYGGKVENIEKVNFKNTKMIDIRGTKVWQGGPEVKPIIELQLYRNNIPHGKPVTLNNGTTMFLASTFSSTSEVNFSSTPFPLLSFHY